MYGVVFALIARAARLHGAWTLVGGVVFGLAVQLVMSVIVLPLVSQDGLVGEIGLPSFTVEHLLFGLTLGLWVALRPQDIPADTPARIGAGRASSASWRQSMATRDAADQSQNPHVHHNAVP